MNNNEKARDAYWEARDGINVKENEKIVLECKTTLSYHFAKNIPKADIKAHEKVILELKDLYCSYCFAKEIPEANIEEHFKLVYNSGDKYYLNLFIKHVNYKSTKVEEWLLYI